jgi:hypothetical protein
MTMILVAGAELYAELQAEKRALVEENARGFNSEQLCVLQRKVAGRGIVGAQIVKSMYGFSVRYDSGLQEWGLIRPSRGLPESERTLAAAEQFCREWVAADPTRRYAWKTELEIEGEQNHVNP